MTVRKTADQRNVFQINIGGVSLSFEAGGPHPMLAALRKRYRAFLSRSPRPAHHFRMRFHKKYGRLPSEARLIEDGRGIRIERSDFKAKVPTGGAGTLDVAVNLYSFDSFLRVFMSWYLPRHGGLLVHAASLLKEGRAYLFPAVSGGGKSTLVRVSGKDSEPLTDEISIIRYVGKRYRAYGSPFWGELKCRGTQIAGPLDGVYFLSKSDQVGLMERTLPQALRDLLQTIMSFETTPDASERLLNRSLHLLRHSNVKTLLFKRDEPIWNTLSGIKVAV